MRKLVKYLFVMAIAIILPCRVLAAGSVTTSTKNLTITKGSSASFTIKAKNAAGRVDISSSNTAIATASQSSVWLDNNSASVKVTGKTIGTTTIVIKQTDVATYDSEVLSGNIVVNVKVIEKRDTPKPDPEPTPTPAPVEKSDAYKIAELGVKKVESSLLKSDYDTVLEEVNALKNENEKTELLDRLKTVEKDLVNNVKCNDTPCVCEECKNVNCTLWIVLCIILLVFTIFENIYLYLRNTGRIA